MKRKNVLSESVMQTIISQQYFIFRELASANDVIYILYFLNFQSGGEDEQMSDNDFSRDGDSPDGLSRVPPTDVDPETLEKLRQQVSHQR